MKMSIRCIIFSLLTFLLYSGCALEAPQPSGRAYVYGVSRYENLKDLDFTDDDARDMAALFSNAGYEAKLRIDDGTEAGTGPATIEQLEKDIEEFITGSTPGELFVFYFAGHGGRYDEIYSSGLPEPPPGVEPSQGEGGDEWLFFSGSIPSLSYETWTDVALKDDELALMLSEIPGGMKLVIIDACKSGGFIGDSTFVDPLPQGPDDADPQMFWESLFAYFGFSEEAAKDIAGGNAFVLTAAGELENSAEINGNGVFTLAFLEAAANGDIDENGYITLHEIYRYIEETWEDRPLTSGFHPHLSGSAVDIVLFSHLPQ